MFSQEVVEHVSMEIKIYEESTWKTLLINIYVDSYPFAIFLSYDDITYLLILIFHPSHLYLTCQSNLDMIYKKTA